MNDYDEQDPVGAWLQIELDNAARERRVLSEQNRELARRAKNRSWNNTKLLLLALVATVVVVVAICEGLYYWPWR